MTRCSLMNLSLKEIPASKLQYICQSANESHRTRQKHISAFEAGFVAFRVTEKIAQV